MEFNVFQQHSSLASMVPELTRVVDLVDERSDDTVC